MRAVERWNSVVETRSYQVRAQKLLTREEEVRVVELLAKDPTCGVVMKGTGGIRKVRVPVGDRGKKWRGSGGLLLPDTEMPVFLLTIFAKNEKDNLSMAERNQLAALVGELKAQWRR